MAVDPVCGMTVDEATAGKATAMKCFSFHIIMT